MFLSKLWKRYQEHRLRKIRISTLRKELRTLEYKRYLVDIRVNLHKKLKQSHPTVVGLDLDRLNALTQQTKSIRAQIFELEGGLRPIQPLTKAITNN
jgi:hypothetical protein